MSKLEELVDGFNTGCECFECKERAESIRAALLAFGEAVRERALEVHNGQSCCDACVESATAIRSINVGEV